jgi:amidophosphoribosyltransferase
MSDPLTHECGIALIRLLKPLEYYQQRYGNILYGLNRMYLLMEKQHNRGQDGAGLACVKFDVDYGHKYINRYRSNSNTPIKDIFARVFDNFTQVSGPNHKNVIHDTNWLKHNVPFAGELFLGHLRYGTFGNNSIEYCHPGNPAKQLDHTQSGDGRQFQPNQRGRADADPYPQRAASLRAYRHADRTRKNRTLSRQRSGKKFSASYKDEGFDNVAISQKIAENLDVQALLKGSCKKMDGGFVMAGLIGHGDAFVLRDPAGIRPAYWYADDEVVVVASERPAIQTAHQCAI